MNYGKKYLLSICLCFSSIHLSAQHCDLLPPTNLTTDSISSCSAILSWSPGTTVLKYLVSYRKKGTGQWSANVNVGTALSCQLTGLQANTKYDFSVVSKCNDGTKSKKVKITATTPACTLPANVSVTAISNTSASITANSSCSFDSLTVEYQPVGGIWKTRTYPAAVSYVLDGLEAGAVYLVRMSTCVKPITEWTAVDTLYLQHKPNIILILLDDARFDYFSCNGAPAFIHTPNIDRIANEGVNFQRAYVVSSLCSPSRATIATGLFTLKTGVTDNLKPLNPNFQTIPKVLGANGYYTALVGKNEGTFLLGDVPEFQYYLESGFNDNDGKHYNFNGNKIVINKADVLTYSDSAIALIKRVNQPLLLWLAYRVPHIPVNPLPAFKGDYDGFPIPWNPDTSKYTNNYPSFLYIGKTLHGYSLDSTYRSTMEDIAGVDSCIGEIIKALENTAKLDNTLLLFMSDNGYLMGSHWLNGKVKAYEPSMRIPLFIRYPSWFAPQSKIKNQFALNMDIASTVYDAAGVTFTGPMDGRSLRDLYSGAFNRQEFYYLMPHNTKDNNTPAIRCIRDQHYKYIHYTCNTDTVEEFFDLENDSLELTNQVNNSAYQSLLAVYRIKYDSIRLAWNDIAPGPAKDCYIAQPMVLKEQLEESEIIPRTPLIYPTVTDGQLEIFIPWEEADVSLFDVMGKFYESWKTTETYSTINLHNLADGCYLLCFTHGATKIVKQVIIRRQ
ncbi:MAG: sulfatase-like hydrolase/transferase [Chitinophagales bacterium]|nr:sulfatase-like hydrolase/transferase [Chitinophagales bacterium]